MADDRACIASALKVQLEHESVRAMWIEALALDCRWLRLPLTVLATAGCLLTVYDSLATENKRVHQPRQPKTAEQRK